MSTTVVGGVPIIGMPDLGAVNDAASFVGERAGSGRFSAVSLQAYMGAGIISQSATAHFWAQDGAKISRVNDRLFVGPATKNDGAYPNVSQDWLQAFFASAVGGSEVGPTIGATMSVLSINGQFGFVAGTRTSDNPTPNSNNTIGISSFAINDNTTVQNNVWAFYGEARRLAGTGMANLTMSCELDVSNQGAYVAAGPYGQMPGGTIALQLGSGCGIATLPGTQDTTAAISIQGNPTKFSAGIVFAANAIHGTDGTTGTGDAIAFAKGHSIVWSEPSGNQTSAISCNVTSFANATDVVFQDAGFTVSQTSNGIPLLIVAPVANAANWVSINAAPVGGKVGVIAGGADTTIDLVLHAKGAAGALDLSGPQTLTATNGSASALPATPYGYLTFKLAGVPFKLPYYAP